MPEYRIFKLKDGRVSEPPSVVECAADDEAVQQAKQLVDGHDVELWTGSRFVTRLPRHGKPA